MKYLVTGSGGQLGREWVDYLSEQNRDFVAYSSGEMNISDPDVVKRELSAVQPSVVINCAAYTDVNGAEDNLDMAMSINRDGVKHLSNWCSRHQVVMVHFSTDFIFPGRREDLVRYPEGYPEEAGAFPVNLYGESKLAGEKELQQTGADFLLIRISWLCGRYGNNFVKTMMRLGEEKERVEVVKDQLGSPTYADAVTKETLALLDQNETGVFHLTSGGLISWFDFAEEIFRMSGISADVKPVMSSEFPSRAARPSFSKLDTTKISRTLGSRMEEWQDGLKRLIGDLKQDK